MNIRKAYALATMKDGSACVAAVAKARMQVEQFEPDSDPRWLYWVTPAEITAGAGDCLLQLGHSGQAAALLDGAIALFDESFARDRQIYLTHLADALARPGKQRDLDAAVDRGLAAVHLAESLASTPASIASVISTGKWSRTRRSQPWETSWNGCGWFWRRKGARIEPFRL